MVLERPGKGLGSVEADVEPDEPPAARCDCCTAAAMAEERVSTFTVTIVGCSVGMRLLCGHSFWHNKRSAEVSITRE